ncbi:MAG: cyclohexanecarboxylate-CoA ligase, partial [Bryobacterales bacterium]|nr:cyclohexanecarboxylate-CoA ligase [Bryobacterales bacterium]
EVDLQGTSGPPLLRYPRTGEEPLSFAQQRLWFLDRFYAGESPMYNIPVSLALTGPLDPGRLSAAFTAISERHEILRTIFRETDGTPVQIIAADATLDLAAEQISEKDLNLRIAEEAARPFDLTRGPLVRVRLYNTGADRHVLLIVMHHIISDMWSFGVLSRDLRDAYAGQALGPLPIQYADFAQWQREWLAGGRLAREASYWKQQLAGAPPLLELPADAPRPARQTFRGGNHWFHFSKDRTDALKRYSRREGATLFMTLLAGFQAILARYTGVMDISVGTPIANRTCTETEELIGFFVNTLVMRTDLSGSRGFRELLGRVREVTLDAYAHQELPFEKLVEILEPERSASYTPLFQVLIVLQNVPTENFSLEGIEAEWMPLETTTARFDVSLGIEEREGCLRCQLNYNRDLFDADRMERMAGHFTTFLAAAIAEPERSIGELPLLTAAEERKLEEWNATRADYPRMPFPELFAEQVGKTPEHVAIECGERAWTYAELDARSNSVAAHLRQAGVGPEVPVGIVVERSLEMMAGLLGIWKAGGAYVPIDPDSPDERQALIRKDSGVSIVLTQSAIRDLGNPSKPISCELTLESLAYVMYTSGSTGMPKGVAVQHSSMINLLEAMRRDTGIGPCDSLLAITTPAFDISVLELWLPLMVGARAILATRGEARDAARLRGLIERSRATIMQGTPTTWTMLLDDGWRPSAGFQILCGAEALPPHLAGRLAKLDRVVWNLFGPTETCVWSTMARVDGGPVTIGRPIANTRVYILDENRQPVPVGVWGELYIGGVGVARGYLNRPELTAEKFVTFAGGERVFRTGDSVRWRADGQLEFAGRLDTQVKLRGFRIELGEIEAALMKSPGVRAVAAALSEDESGDKRLVAYLVADDVTGEQLRRSLERQLPDYIIPSRFVFLDALPLSANGKVDRRALPAPEDIHEPERTSVIAPRTQTEEMIANIFAEVLRLDWVGVEDNFFHLGGHSLLATQVISRIRHRLAVEVALSTLFEDPSVAGLARRIGEDGCGSIGPPLRPYTRTGHEPVSFAQQRLWFLERYYEGQTPMYNLVDALPLAGPLDIERLRAAFEGIVERHETLRTSFGELDGNPVQIAASEGRLDFAVEQVAPEDLRGCIAAETKRPFDLTRGSLMRVKLYSLAAERHVLAVVVHHIVTDGWSFGVLYRELRDRYEGRPVAKLAIQYVDYAQWQREWLTGRRLEREVSYWKAQLAGAPPLLALPLDRPRPAIQTFAAGNCKFSLDEELTGA